MSKFDQKFTTLLEDKRLLPDAGNQEIGLDDAEIKANLEKLNAGLAGLTATPSINPYYIVGRVRDRIYQLTGLTFTDQYFRGETGTWEAGLYRQNGSNDAWDKLFQKNYGLRVRFTFVKVGNLYHVDTEILPSLPIPVPVTETKD